MFGYRTGEALADASKLAYRKHCVLQDGLRPVAAKMTLRYWTPASWLTERPLRGLTGRTTCYRTACGLTDACG